MFRGVQDSLYLCIVATILSRFSCNAVQKYKHIGCYSDDRNNRALTWIDHVNSDNAIEECAVKADKKGYNIFAVQFGIECWSQGHTAFKTYDKYGKSTACRNGVGGSLANDVYQFIVQPYKHIGCYNDDENPERALPEHLGDFSRDHVVKQCAFAASNKGYNTFGIQYDGWSGLSYRCYSGPNADQTYMKYGKSTNCGSDGIGDSWANDVYQFTDEILWPEGTYSLLKPSSGCPSQWVDNGFVLQDTVDNVNNNRSSMLHMDGYVANSYVVTWFCMKTKRTSPDWPTGKYCIYKAGSRNPPNMEEGWIRMDNKWSAQNKDTVNLISRQGIVAASYSIRFYFFCKTTGVKSQPIDLPITHPFYLLPYGSAECQQVKWMVATSEWIQYGTRNYKSGSSSWKSATGPYIIAGTTSTPGITMYYCYYESCNKTLTDMKGTFQSPRFPDKYPDGQLCSWKIRVPANHTIHVYFTTFSLAVENGNDTDVLEFYTSTNDSLELVEAYRGSLESFKVNSTSDLMFVFRSNQANSSSGFNAEYHIILDEDPTTVSLTTTDVLTETQPLVQQSTNQITDAFKSTDSSHGSAEDSTTGSPTTTEIQPSIQQSSHDSLKDNREGTGTTILIVIPLVCFILVVVVTIDIIYRCRLSSRLKNKEDDTRTGNDAEQVAVNPIYGKRSNSRLKAQKDNQRNYNHDDDQAADNPTYGKRSVTSIPMTHFNSTTTVNTTLGQTDEDNDQSYERLGPRNMLPKHDVPEQYGQLNRAAQPIKTEYQNDRDSRVPLQNKGPVYQTLKGPDSEAVDDDEIYHTIDEKPSSNDLYERNILYDRVA